MRDPLSYDPPQDHRIPQDCAVGIPRAIFTNTTHPILGLRIFEGSHLPIKIRTMDPEYNRWQGIPAVLQYSPLLPGLCVVIHLLAGFLEQSGL